MNLPGLETEKVVALEVVEEEGEEGGDVAVDI